MLGELGIDLLPFREKLSYNLFSLYNCTGISRLDSEQDHYVPTINLQLSAARVKGYVDAT